MQGRIQDFAIEGVCYEIVVLCAERSEAPFQLGGWRIFLISNIFKRHSEAYAQSICMHDLTIFVSLILI